jgi:hypothetical protein
MIRTPALGLALALVILVPPTALAAEAEQAATQQDKSAGAPPSDTDGLECGHRALADCTGARILALESLSRDLDTESLQRSSHPTDPFGAPDTEQQQLNYWLKAWSNEAANLAQEGHRAAEQETEGGLYLQRSFNLRYLSFRERIRDAQRQLIYTGDEARRRQNSLRSRLARLP